MPPAIDPGHLQLHELRHRCATETERFFHRQEYDPRYCFELFRRALVERDQDAWEYVYSQYQLLVTGWVRRHPLFSLSTEEPRFFVNRAFERIWAGLTAEKFTNFSDLKSVLRYLQMCVHAVLVDSARASQRASSLEDEALPISLHDRSHHRSMEDSVLRRTQADELWSLLAERCKDERERRVLYGIFVNDLKPRQLLDENRGVFQNVQEIYRIKENLLDRLRRDGDLVEYMENLG